MKKIVMYVCMMLFIILFSGCSGENAREDSKDDPKRFSYFVSQEEALLEDGTILFRIEYKYDSNGNESSRTAYDGDGNQDSKWLDYAYDERNILEEYWKTEPHEENAGKRYFKLHTDYEFEYDSNGNLITQWFYDDNELGIDKITYSYKKIKVSKRAEGSSEAQNKSGEYFVDSEKNSSDLNDANLSKERLSLQELIENGDGTIIVDGEECYARWGETGALVWKYVDATFEERAYFASSFAIDEHSSSIYMSSPMPDGWDASRVVSWHKWYDFEEFSPYHIGDDMFILEGNFYGAYYCFYINAINSVSHQERELSEEGKDEFTRCSNYNDGYMIGAIECYDGTRLIAVDKNWNFTYSGIYVNEYCAGQYSDGVFYYEGVFYDIEFNEILDISDKGWGRVYTKANVYAPFFEDGICRIITYKNGKYWIFSIDKEGEIVSDVEEFDLNLLNY